jgi:exonuclease 3'-5' domain-containing protein 1
MTKLKEIKSASGKETNELGFSIVFVDTSKMLVNMVETLELENIINVDFEGVNLCKTGKVCLGQFHASGSDLVYIVDFVVMNPFKEANGRLKDILESEKIKKIFFDPRNDVDAIANIYSVHPQNVICLQLAEVATRLQNGLNVRFVLGLHKTMEKYLQLDSTTLASVMKVKSTGITLFAPEFGGSYAVFEQRPVSNEILNYAAVDVYYFDELYKKLFGNLSNLLTEKVIKLSKERLVAYKNPNFNPKSRDNCIAPSFY